MPRFVNLESRMKIEFFEGILSPTLINCILRYDTSYIYIYIDKTKKIKSLPSTLFPERGGKGKYRISKEGLDKSSADSVPLALLTRAPAILPGELLTRTTVESFNRESRHRA